MSAAFLDMDGTLVDFCGAVMRHFEYEGEWTPGETDICEVVGVTQEDMEQELFRDASFWYNLELLPWANQLIEYVDDHFDDWYILTKPSTYEESFAGKVAWLHHHQIDIRKRSIMTAQKHLIAAAGRVLIDDTDKMVDNFRSAGGKAVLVPQPWNTDAGFSGDKFEYIIAQLGQLA